MRIATVLLVFLAGCGPNLPRLERLGEIPDDSCHVRTWEIRSRGLSLPKVPLTLQTEEESDHLAGSLLGDWGRVLASFRLDSSRISGEKPWFSGVGTGYGELAGLSVGLWDPARLAEALGKGWSARLEDTLHVLVRDGRAHSLWAAASPRGRTVRDAAGNWQVDASLMQEQALSPGSCRGR
jgi:hypothetical protein